MSKQLNILFGFCVCVGTIASIYSLQESHKSFKCVRVMHFISVFDLCEANDVRMFSLICAFSTALAHSSLLFHLNHHI